MRKYFMELFAIGWVDSNGKICEEQMSDDALMTAIKTMEELERMKLDRLVLETTMDMLLCLFDTHTPETFTEVMGNLLGGKYVSKVTAHLEALEELLTEEEWAKKQAEKQKASSDSNGAMATTTSADATGTEETTTSPLPQEAQASEPTDAKGTVDERTVTGIEEQLAQEGETADTVTKTATEGTKEFYTISTKSGKIFYLIIDNSKSQDNVYFLTEVSEKDLMNFTLSDSVTLPEVDTVYAEPEKQTEEEKPENTDTEEKEKEEEEVQMPEDKNPVGTYLLIALVAVGAAAGGYYLKVYKPKHEYDDEDEMEDEEDESEDSESEKREVDDADEQEEGTEPEILRDEDFDDAVLEDEEEEQE